MRVPRAERERQILDAAVGIFGERGYRSASMDAVAERVGVTKPVLYTHFGSKEGLLRACVARIRADLLEATSAAAEAAPDTEGKLRASTLAFFRHVEEHAAAWRLIDAEATLANEAVEGIRAQQADFVAGLLATHAPDVPPRRLAGWARVIVGGGERLAHWRACDPDVTAEEATEHLMDLVWRGLGTMRP